MINIIKILLSNKLKDIKSLFVFVPMNNINELNFVNVYI